MKKTERTKKKVRSIMSDIAYCKIFPSIGIARVGDSPTEFFIGPEAPGCPPDPQGGFKDVGGQIKRQAARFRIYGFDENDVVVKEITASTPGYSVTWSVELANRKAAWFEFDGDTKGQQVDKTGKGTPRNAGVADRSKLAITPGPRSIAGKNQSGARFQFDSGFFFDIPVPLGELQTDDDGRLLVLGGSGKSGGTADAKPITQYANNDYWHDDTADGPVTATVTANGANIPVKGTAWVLVAPPKFAPTLPNIVTLYDVMAEVGGVQPPAALSFVKDVFPFFARMADYQWVNERALRGHGPQKRGNFRDPAILKMLADNSAPNAAYRKSVFDRIRNPRLKSKDQANYYFMPILSGDEGDTIVGNPDTWLYVLESQYAMLEKWAAGNFASDWDPNKPIPPAPSLDQIPLGEQPSALTRGALEFCVGGPFFPGIEITYVARYADYYEEPFRFKQGKFEAGDMTKRMAVPWQADFFECQVHWWPAQRPDDVVNEEMYANALEHEKEDARDGHLANVLQDRIRWDRGIGDRVYLPPPALPGDNDMVEKWKTMGFVVPQTTPYNEIVYVETGRSRYDGLRHRDYFYYILNIDAYPDFLPQAKRLAEEFLQNATNLINSTDPNALDDMYRYFDYTPEALGQRLDEIYAFYQRDAETNPLDDPSNIFKSRDDMIERVRQYAPLNQMDGAWIRNIAHPGPIDRVTANLFNVWMDEMGDGDPQQNHCNVYKQLLDKVGIQLPPVYTKEYVNNPDILDSAYTVPMYELAISQFTPTYFAEILGMTLQLEWEVLALKPTITLFHNFGLDPHFYELHVGIDNAASGHGAKARQAVEWYLDEALARGGDAEVQREWRRIWTGYVAFANSGTLGQDFRDLLNQRHNSPETPADKVARLMELKKPYGRLNHGERRLGANQINDLFEDPPAFMQALIDNNYIVPGSPAESSFFHSISFEGPMYKVFTDDEIQIWQDWVVWLGQKEKPQPPVTDPAKLMASCVDALRERQMGTPGHSINQLKGPDPKNPGQTITQPVSEWFKAPTRAFLSVLSDPANGWIVKGDSGRSRFVTELLSSNNAMSSAFNGSAPNSGGKTWKQIAIDWIDHGCPLPVEPARATKPFVRSAEALGRRRLGRLTLTSPQSVVDAHPRGRVLGMGCVH
jgi:hypothetical protein